MRRIPVRIFIFLSMSIIIAVTSLGAGFYLLNTAHKNLLQEKQNKLFAFTQLLDNGLAGTFNDILVEEGEERASRPEKINTLNRRLAPFTDLVAASQDGIGVGYYSKELDAIITYGPSRTLGHMVSLSIDQAHQGRRVMDSGKPLVQTGQLVRGTIMNCMAPLIRNQKVIGYVWANELVDDINRQFHNFSSTAYMMIALGIVVSFIGTALIAQLVGGRIKEIVSAIKIIEKDQNYRIPPIAGDLGKIAGSINSFADHLAQQRKMEEQLQRTDRLVALGEITAGVAHEIRSPLTAIKGFVQLIESELLPEHPHREYTSLVISETDRLDKMLHELLYYSRPSDPHMVPTDINAIIDKTLKLVKVNSDSRKVAIHLDLATDLPLIEGDQEQLKQVFLNLIINAIQAVENYGEIWITTRVSSNRIEIAIEDSGKGIAPEILNKLFNPFFTTRSNGTGLGLAVAQKIIDLHQGKIQVENRTEHGARFLISFPLLAQAEETGQKTDEAAS